MRCYVVPAVGQSRGIVIVWRKSMGHVYFVHNNCQVVFGIISVIGAPSWILGIVYASTSVFQRCNLWSQVQDVLGLGYPLLLAGDFNCILTSQDKKGENPLI